MDFGGESTLGPVEHRDVALSPADRHPPPVAGEREAVRSKVEPEVKHLLLGLHVDRGADLVLANLPGLLRPLRHQFARLLGVKQLATQRRLGRRVRPLFVLPHLGLQAAVADPLDLPLDLSSPQVLGCRHWQMTGESRGREGVYR